MKNIQLCNSLKRCYICTLKKNHKGKHIAHGKNKKILKIW